MKTKKTVYIDMDQVLVDFHSHPTLHIPKDYNNHPNMFRDGYFYHLAPLAGAIEAATQLLNRPDLDVYILTQPVAGTPHSYSDKAKWVEEHLPDFSKRLIMTQNKLLNKGDYLVDDSLKWSDFDGKFIHFDYKGDTVKEWDRVLKEII